LARASLWLCEIAEVAAALGCTAMTAAAHGHTSACCKRSGMGGAGCRVERAVPSVDRGEGRTGQGRKVYVLQDKFFRDFGPARLRVSSPGENWGCLLPHRRDQRSRASRERPTLSRSGSALPPSPLLLPFGQHGSTIGWPGSAGDAYRGSARTR
jgi:hypothetical protein